MAGLLIACGAVMTVSALFAQSAEKQWPSDNDKLNVEKGFTNALTRSAKDKYFRERLLQFTKPDLVKAAVQEELNKVPGAEKMVIPPEIVIIFYVPQKAAVRDESEVPVAAGDFLGKNENRNYFVLYLPDYDPSDTKEHTFIAHLRCCYKPWLPPGR